MARELGSGKGVEWWISDGRDRETKEGTWNSNSDSVQLVGGTPNDRLWRHKQIKQASFFLRGEPTEKKPVWARIAAIFGRPNAPCRLRLFAGAAGQGGCGIHVFQQLFLGKPDLGRGQLPRKAAEEHEMPWSPDIM